MRGPTQKWAQRGAYALERTTETIGASQVVKNTPTKARDPVRSLDQEDPLEEEMATHSNILAWRIPWTEEPGKESDMTELLNNNRDS